MVAAQMFIVNLDISSVTITITINYTLIFIFL